MYDGMQKKEVRNFFRSMKFWIRKTPAGQAPHAGEISAGHLADGQNNPHAPIAEFNTKI
jgi:hypothetical protein